MLASSGGISFAPPRPLWVPSRYATAPQAMSLRYQTWICDVDERYPVDDPRHITRMVPGQSGWNTITDWGMDALPINRQDQLVEYLHLSDTLGPAKRSLTGGTTISLTITDPSTITATSSANFFLVGDVGKTLSITDLGGAGQTQELKITAFGSATSVSCSTRGGAWLPGFTAGTGPFSTAAVHPTDTTTLANQFQKFNSKDGTASNNDNELNDSSNSRMNHQRIFLSPTNSGTTWTINELGWSDGNVSNNVFGRVNLATPDSVANGKKYRLQLNFYSGYTPIDISGQSVNWGATIGTYTVDVRTEILPFDHNVTGTSPFITNFLRPFLGGFHPRWYTAAFTMASIKWEGDAGFDPTQHGNSASGGGTNVFDATYTNGTHKNTRSVKWDDSLNISAATALTVHAGTTDTIRVACAVRPTTGTITKASGFYAQLDFGLFWTRAFTN